MIARASATPGIASDLASATHEGRTADYRPELDLPVDPVAAGGNLYLMVIADHPPARLQEIAQEFATYSDVR